MIPYPSFDAARAQTNKKILKWKEILAMTFRGKHNAKQGVEIVRQMIAEHGFYLSSAALSIGLKDALDYIDDLERQLKRLKMPPEPEVTVTQEERQAILDELNKKYE